MPDIKPFKGYVYNSDIAGQISDLVAPPWDIIREKEKEVLLNKSPYNVVRLTLEDIDPESVKKLFTDWVHDRILKQDEEESIYSMTHCFRDNGREVKRSGFFAILKLEKFEDGNVIPHERIFPRYMDNRLRLIGKCKANFSPVFMLYEDREFVVEDAIRKASCEISEGSINNETFSFGRIADRSVIRNVQSVLEPGKLFIADGHHRYNAALNNYLINSSEENKYVLVFLVNMYSPNLVIYPTHRLIPGKFLLSGNEENVQKFFELQEVSNKDEMLDIMQTDGKFGVFEKGKFYVMTIRNMDLILPYLPSDYSEEWRLLDTVILHYFIIPEVMKTEKKEFLYARNCEYLLLQCSEMEKGTVIFLNPVGIGEFRKIVLNGDVMPQKSTFFYPKVPTGLVIHKF